MRAHEPPPLPPPLINTHRDDDRLDLLDRDDRRDGREDARDDGHDRPAVGGRAAGQGEEGEDEGGAHGG